jgi:phosphohistidine phosphatase
MKTVTLVRHAKAEKPEAFPTDYVRPLAPRGHKDAERMAAFLARQEPAVDLILSSPAARAAQTADHLSAELGATKTVTWSEEIYLASAEALLAILRGVPDEAEHVLLVGHNPGLEELTAGLCSGATDNGVITLPTAAVVQLGIEISRWSQLRWGLGRLRFVATPKMMK